MAAVMNVEKRTLSISIARGQDAEGNAVSKNYTYSNVKPDAEPAKRAGRGRERRIQKLHVQQRKARRGTGQTGSGRHSAGRSLRQRDHRPHRSGTGIPGK